MLRVKIRESFKTLQLLNPIFRVRTLENMVVTAWAVNIWLKLNYHLLLTFWSLMLDQICTLYWICTDMYTQKFSNGSFEGNQSLGMAGLMDIFLYFNFFGQKRNSFGSTMNFLSHRKKVFMHYTTTFMSPTT